MFDRHLNRTGSLVAALVMSGFVASALIAGALFWKYLAWPIFYVLATAVLSTGIAPPP